METGATDDERKAMLALYIENKEDEAKEVIDRIVSRNEKTIVSMVECERRCAKKFEDRHRKRLGVRAEVMGTLAGTVLAGWILVIGVWQMAGVEPGVLESAGLSLVCGMLGKFSGWYIAR